MIAERLEKATPENWMFPPAGVWTAAQVEDLVLPCDWELVDGVVVVRGRPPVWHSMVRSGIERRLQECVREPFFALSEQCVLIDEFNPPVPDVIVFDTRGLDDTAKHIPVAQVVLAVEVVSEGSRQDDRVRKPALYASAGIPCYWRVERGEDGLPEVHEYWLNPDRGEYIPRPVRPCHTDKLETDQPYPVTIDLANLVAALQPPRQ